MTPPYFPVVIERESNGSYSAWIAGLPGVYAAADTAAAAKRAVRGALTAHLSAAGTSTRRPATKTVVTVLRWDAAARRYGMKGGRPRADSR